MPFMYCKMWYDVTDNVIGLKSPQSPVMSVKQKHAPDIEVVGERCRRKGEPRPLNVVEVSDGLSLSSANFRSKDNGIPPQPPPTSRRPATTGHSAYLNSSLSWRHTPFYRRENSPATRSLGGGGGGLTDDRRGVSRGETGVKVKISYVDRKGRVSAVPRAHVLSAHVAPVPADIDGESAPQGQHHHQHQQQQHYPDDSWNSANGLSGWDPEGPHPKVSATSVTDRLYRHSSRMSRDKAFSVVLDDHHHSNHPLDYNGYPDDVGIPFGGTSEYGSTEQIGGGRRGGGGEHSPERMASRVTSSSVPSLGRHSRSKSAPRYRGSAGGAFVQPGDSSFPAGGSAGSYGADFYSSSPNLAKATSGNDVAGGHHGSKDILTPKMSSTPNINGNLAPASSSPTKERGCLIHSSIGSFYSSDPRLANYFDDHRFHHLAGSTSASVNSFDDSIKTSAAPYNSNVTSLHSSLSMIPHNENAGAVNNCLPEHFPSQQKPPLPPQHHQHHQHHQHQQQQQQQHQEQQQSSPQKSSPDHHPQHQTQQQQQPSQKLSSIQQQDPHPSQRTPPQQPPQQQHQRRPLYHQRHLSDRLPLNQMPRPFTTASSGVATRRRSSISRAPDCVKEQLISLYTSCHQRRARSAAAPRCRRFFRGRALGRDGSGGSGGGGGVGGSRRQSVQRTSLAGGEGEPSVPVSRLFRKFRMVGFIALTLIRLKAAIVVNSSDRTERSAAEIQWRTLFGGENVNRLAFNKSYYSREKISTKIPQWAMDILEMTPEDRTEQNCRRLHALLRGLRCFDKFTEEIQLNLCRAFSFSHVDGSRIIIRRGHVGHNYYLIYSGSVFVNVKDVDNTGEPFIKTEAILARGDSFGELALLQDIGRTATIAVREPCELLVVDKDVFGRVCPKIFEKELMEKKKFMLGLTLFNPKVWTPEALKTLCLEAQIQEYKINRIIVENNRTEDWLYICMEGKCQVIRCLSGNGAEDDVAKPTGRDETLALLSQEIIELLSSGKRTAGAEEEEEEENSKEKLLASLGLEYADTGKKNTAFIQEMAEEERKKSLRATTGPTTLTALMTQQRKESKSPLVYLNVCCIEADEIFDLSSLIKCPGQPRSSSLILVSSGARMLRVKKTAFTRLASPEAMQHTATLISKQTVPTDEAILESYKTQVAWEAYKAKVLKEMFASRCTRKAAAQQAQLRSCEGDKNLIIESALTSSTPDPGKTPTKSTKPQSHKPAKRKKPKFRGSANTSETTTTEDQRFWDDDVIEEVDEDRYSADGEEETEGSQEQRIAAAGSDKEEQLVEGSDEDDDSNEDRRPTKLRLGAASAILAGEEEAAPAIFPVVQVDISEYPPTPRFVPPKELTGSAGTGQEPLCPQVKSSYGIGPAPTHVIIHRATGAPGVYRPYSAQDTQFKPAGKPTKGYHKIGDVDTDSDDEPDEDY